MALLGIFSLLLTHEVLADEGGTIDAAYEATAQLEGEDFQIKGGHSHA